MGNKFRALTGHVLKPQTLTETAPAKLNLFLHVTGRRADGYHLLDSLFVFTRRGDMLRYDPDAEISPYPYPAPLQSNSARQPP